LEEQEKNINPDDIISCLNKYPKARVKYLEHLVLERKIEVSPTRILKISIGFRMQTVMNNFEKREVQRNKHNLKAFRCAQSRQGVVLRLK